MRFREVTERYRLDKILRSTRTGSVLRAVDSQSGQTVAVKLITVGASPGFAEGAPKLLALVEALAAVPHPGLPPVLDSGFTPDGSAFLVFPYLEGRSFEALPPGAQALPLLLQALDTLEALAAHGVAHHNLSPDNLWLVDTPAGQQVKLLGVGTAIFQTPDGPNARFRAPELAAPGTADSRADLYSFALTACKGLGATESLGDGRDPVVQMPFALSFELENAEGIRQVLELCLRQDPAQRPAPAVIREAWRPALAALGAPDAFSEGADGWQDGPAWQEKTAPILFPDLISDTPQSPDPGMALPLTPTTVPAPAIPAATPIPPVQAMPPLPAPPPLTAQPAAAQPAAAAMLAGAAAAPAMPPLPDPDADLFPEITDDILNALPEDWQPGAASGAAAPARGLPFGKGKPAAAPPASGEAPAEGTVPPGTAVPVPLLRRPAVLGGVGLLLLLLVAAGLWLATRPSGEEAPALPATSAGGPDVPAVPARKPVGERLEQARLLVAEGNDFEAREVLRAFNAADQAALSPAQCETLSQLEQTLTLSARDRMPEDLKAGLKGDLVRLRNAVAAAADLPPGEVPEALRADLVKALQAADLYTQAEEAARAKQTVVVLERLGSLDDLIPGFEDPKGLREQAAAALESEARALVEQGKYEPAVAYLQPIQSTWPDRPGFAELIASYQGFQRAEASQKSLLEKLAAIERRRKPHEGLEAMAGVEPVPNLAGPFADMRRRLEAQLTQIDGQAPKVALRDGFYLEYSRGTVANLSFRVTDDYEVRSVKMMARPEGGKMREVPLKKSTFGYDAEIPTSLHQNGTVEFYVVATDRSGHDGFFGSSSQPAQLKRVGGGRF